MQTAFTKIGEEKTDLTETGEEEDRLHKNRRGEETDLTGIGEEKDRLHKNRRGGETDLTEIGEEGRPT